MSDFGGGSGGNSPSWMSFLQALQDITRATNSQSPLGSLTDLVQEITIGVDNASGVSDAVTPVAFHALIGTSSTTVVTANTTTRAGLMFHNPGTVDLFICPSVDNAGLALAAGGAGSFRLTPGQSLPLVGLCGGAFNAAAASGSNNPVTVWEYRR